MKIVNVKKYRGDYVYCGRSGYGKVGCVLHNPFSHEPKAKAIQVKDRDAAIEAFRVYLWAALHNAATVQIEDVGSVRIQINRLQVLAFLKTLDEESVLGCYCSPLRCHCEVIASCWEWLKRTNQLD